MNAILRPEELIRLLGQNTTAIHDTSKLPPLSSSTRASNNLEHDKVITIDGYARICDNTSIYFTPHPLEPSLRIPIEAIATVEVYEAAVLLDTRRVQVSLYNNFMTNTFSNPDLSYLRKHALRSAIAEYDDPVAEWSVTGVIPNAKLVVVCPTKCRQGVKVRVSDNVPDTWGVFCKSDPGGDNNFFWSYQFDHGDWLPLHEGDNCHSQLTYYLEVRWWADPPPPTSGAYYGTNIHPTALHRSYDSRSDSDIMNVSYDIQGLGFLHRLKLDFCAPSRRAVCGIILTADIPASGRTRDAGK